MAVKEDKLPPGIRSSTAAAESVWPWQTSDMDGRAARVAAVFRRAALRATIGLMAAGLLGWFAHPTPAIIVATIATLTFVLAVASPLRAYASLERVLAALARGAGLLVGWLVLLPIFFGFFVPFGLLFRRGEKDSMKRRFAPDLATYWRRPHDDRDALTRSRSQF